MYLRNVRLKKWANFPQDLFGSYDHVEVRNFGLIALNIRLVFPNFRLMTFDVTFAKPPPVAVVMRGSGGVNSRGTFSVYSFVDPTLYTLPDPEYFSVLANTTRPWNISVVYTDAVITFEEISGKIPKELLEEVALTPVRHVAFHRCFFHSISFTDIPPMKSIQHLEFSQSPIMTVDPKAFDLILSDH
ncbi:hypothetical protein HPB48_017782 [Haemaphysalis longicornis]|uniref:Uncharacterized protein n=1 Tax=Haemaphysalis longicornis TaxID=44386 RepID=A0A9J6FTC4_HAELO|nr:hypothetical protein HPB48_017782 [Haemaphysalis longicornis]